MRNRPELWNGIQVPYGASIEELTRLTRGPAPLRWAAFVALAYTQEESALTLLRESAEASDPHVRRIAAEAIGVHLQGPRLGTVIGRLLSDSDQVVVRSACEAAARHHLMDTHAAILGLLDTPDESTRLVAVRALRDLWIQADFGRVFQAFTSDPSSEVRKEAAWTLRAGASSSTWQELFAAWHVDAIPRHRAWAAELAAAYGDKEVLPQVRRLANDVDGHVRYRATQAARDLEAR
jgi:HEAT repeat protein